MPVKVMQWGRPELFLSTQVISLSEEPCLSIWARQSFQSYIFWRKIQTVIWGAEHLWQFFTMTQPSVTAPALQKKKRAGFWLSAILSMQDIVKSNKQTWWEKYRKPVSHQTLLILIPVPSPSCLLHSHCQVSYLRNWVLKRLPVYHLIC